MSNAWLEIDAAVLRANIGALQAVVRPGTTVIFVVKSDAYGHGLVPVAREAAQAGIRWFGVAHTHEARALRQALPDAEILVMGASDPAEAALLGADRITPIVVDAAHGRALAQAARAGGVALQAHLKLDTGMGRLGTPANEALETFRILQSEPGLKLVGVCSHFATVEPDFPQGAARQAGQFLELTRSMESLNGSPLCKHISSSRAILYHPEWDLNAVRPGICLYGYGAADPRMRFQTRPCLQWKCRVMQVKAVPTGQAIGYYGTYVTPAPTRIAVLSAGYADGYHRALSNRGHVLIRGRRCPVIGRVSMNWITADLGPDGVAEQGDEAVLIGTQQETSVWAGELARLCRTIPYEMLVGIDRHAQRRYLNAASKNPP